MKVLARQGVRYLGMDLHKELIVICIVDEAGKVLHRHRDSCSRDEFEQFARRYLHAIDKVALEVTVNT